MLDIKWIRANQEEFKLGMIKRGEASLQHPENKKIIDEAKIDATNKQEVLEALLKNASRVVIEKIQPLDELDEKRRQAIFEADKLKTERNAVSKEVGRRKANKEPADDLLSGMKEVSNKINYSLIFMSIRCLTKKPNYFSLLRVLLLLARSV